jgi:hypothetical protein
LTEAFAGLGFPGSNSLRVAPGGLLPLIYPLNWYIPNNFGFEQHTPKIRVYTVEPNQADRWFAG